ncbi:hypothetical protein SETIT_4G163800v2 [Setaria italica]|uniref:Uncharacterized protein n=1 Tax=Setaria italica TaxID=4555 RepID=A0A368QVB9_SETIT|nr:hypothetical protein SETIT_4G163800v2 [Setaria italica]
MCMLTLPICFLLFLQIFKETQQEPLGTTYLSTNYWLFPNLNFNRSARW